MLLNAASKKNLLRLVFAAFFVVSTTILLIMNVPVLSTVGSFIFTSGSDETLSTTPCLNKFIVFDFIQESFNKSGRTIPPNQFSLNPAQPDLKFSKENLNRTLAQLSSLMRVEEVNCQAIFKGSEFDIETAVTIAKDVGTPICDKMYTDLTTDCGAFQTFRGYIMSPLTREEEDFPLAFSLVVYKDAEMVERLLRAIYRPQNSYCIHVDHSSSETFFRAISDIANCFTNVVIASKRIDVVWGEYSVLETELLCMEELWRFPKWKYFFTLTGQEFPLKTNLELVRILKAYNGANDVLTTRKYADESRWRHTLPPHGIKPVKGSVHIVVNRDYVDYILHNDTARDLLEWTKTTNVPDETFFAILNANPQLGIRGTYTGEPEMSEQRPFMARYKNWQPEPCAGKYVRAICILSTGDLPSLLQAKHLIANKFHLNQDRVVIGCLEEKIFNDTRDEYMGTKNFNTSYYSGLDFVINQVF